MIIHEGNVFVEGYSIVTFYNNFAWYSSGGAFVCSNNSNVTIAGNSVEEPYIHAACVRLHSRITPHQALLITVQEIMAVLYLAMNSLRLHLKDIQL